MKGFALSLVLKFFLVGAGFFFSLISQISTVFVVVKSILYTCNPLVLSFFSVY